MKKINTLIILVISLMNIFASAEEIENLDQVFICDLRMVFGTCVEYNSRMLTSEAVEFHKESCSRKQYGDNTGKYYNNRLCSTEKRIGSCINSKTFGGKKDTHYYNGTSEDYPWKVDGFKSSCSQNKGTIRVD